jgi:hypothetical protein
MQNDTNELNSTETTAAAPANDPAPAAEPTNRVAFAPAEEPAADAPAGEQQPNSEAPAA